jgi:methyl-accepting chemotaxis protein
VDGGATTAWSQAEQRPTATATATALFATATATIFPSHEVTASPTVIPIPTPVPGGDSTWLILTGSILGLTILAGALVLMFRTLAVYGRQIAQLHLELRDLREQTGQREVRGPTQSDTSTFERRLSRAESSIEKLGGVIPELQKDLQNFRQFSPHLLEVDKELHSLMEKLEHEVKATQQSIQDVKRQLNNMSAQSRQLNETHNTGAARTEHNRQGGKEKELDTVNQTMLDTLVSVYDIYRGDEMFVPVSLIVQGLIKRGTAHSEEEAIRLINSLARSYPQTVRLEAIRGRSGNHLAIYE